MGRITTKQIVKEKVEEANLEYPQRNFFDIKDGVILCGSDGHYIPKQKPATAHRAFVKFVKQIKPDAVIYVGDAFDFSTISRFGRRLWDKQHKVADELEEVKDRLMEIELAAPRRIPLFYNMANHDLRFETFLSNKVGEFEGVKGLRLIDHMNPRWKLSWSLWINQGELVVKHRFKSGVHSTHNAALWAGKNICCAHLHSLKATPVTDYSGTRWGIDCGTLANPYAPQFSYQEDNPRNHRSGFVVLTFKDGKLLPPELVHVYDEAKGEICFRGEIVKV